MALIPEYTTDLGYPDQKLILFEDTTPAYDVTDEPGGYGTPNIAKAAVFKTVISLKAPGADDFTELIDVDYLPADGQIEITCDNYDPDAEEEDDDDEDIVVAGCDTCHGESVLSDCLGVEASCFMDGCWQIKYDVYSDADTIAGTVTQDVFFYMQVRAALQAIGLRHFTGTNQINDKSFIDLYYEAKDDYESMLFNIQVAGCECACATNSLSSLQKKIIKLQQDPLW
jgi:hypothetical protein